MTAAAVDEIDIVAQDWRPTRVESREAIRVAIMRTAADHNGRVHIIGIRQHLPAWTTPAQIGAVVCLLVRHGYLVPTGRTRPNGDLKARNRTKRSEVRKLVRPIPPEAVQ